MEHEISGTLRAPTYAIAAATAADAPLSRAACRPRWAGAQSAGRL